MCRLASLVAGCEQRLLYLFLLLFHFISRENCYETRANLPTAFTCHRTHTPIFLSSKLPDFNYDFFESNVSGGGALGPHNTISSISHPDMNAMMRTTNPFKTGPTKLEQQSHSNSQPKKISYTNPIFRGCRHYLKIL